MKFRITNPVRAFYDEHNLDKTMRKDLNLLIFAVSMAMVFFPITTGAPLTGFAKALGAGDFFYGLMLAVPVLGAAMQIYASWVTERTGKRKKLFIITGTFGRGIWLLVGLVPFIFPEAMAMGRLLMVMLIITSSYVSLSFVNVCFFSWMGDLIPLEIRGRYLGIRASASSIFGLIAAVVTALILDSFSSFSGYAFVFGLAAFCGVADILSYIFVTDMKPAACPRDRRESFAKVTRTVLSNKRFRKFLLFWTVWLFAFNMSFPYANMYALGMLSLTFLQLTLGITVAFSITRTLIVPVWGRLLDRHDSKWVLLRGGMAEAFAQFLWLLARPHAIWPLFVFNIAHGMTFPALDITTIKMQMTATPAKNRTMYIAMYSVFTAVFGTALGYICGGAILQALGDISFHIGPMVMDRYKILFISAGLLRLAVVLLFAGGNEDSMEDE